MAPLELDQIITVHPKVSIRPERFGALLYHFGTRQLSFLKEPKLLDLIRNLDGCKSLEQAMLHAGVPAGQSGRYVRAIEMLLKSTMLLADTTQQGSD